PVVARAREVLAQLEAGEAAGSKAGKLVDDLPLFSVALRRDSAKPARPDLLAEAVAALRPDDMTPKDALETLYRLKGLLRPAP
ncbi:MAG: hypothetical protein KGZ68_11040, partial [Dechloromonas sp.]|nr:hypothetical protein [Dechloromonas sp.]